jgi:hypothetical protein
MDDEISDKLQKLPSPSLNPKLRSKILTEAHKKWHKSPVPWRFILSLAALFMASFILNQALALKLNKTNSQITKISAEDYQKLSKLIAVLRSKK